MYIYIYILLGHLYDPIGILPQQLGRSPCRLHFHSAGLVSLAQTGGISFVCQAFGWVPRCQWRQLAKIHSIHIGHVSIEHIWTKLDLFWCLSDHGRCHPLWLFIESWGTCAGVLAQTVPWHRGKLQERNSCRDSMIQLISSIDTAWICMIPLWFYRSMGALFILFSEYSLRI